MAATLTKEAFPKATEAHIRFFQDHGWLVVEDVVPQADLDTLESYCDRIIENKEKLALDWAWDAREDKDKRSFRIIQSSPSLVWAEIDDQPYRLWMTEFASALMGTRIEFWYDQFLAKPPGRSVPTYWHQDEGYWGRNLFDKGITCWLPLQDVDTQNGCMHFIDGGHKLGVLDHHEVEGMASDLLTCDVDEARMVACPIRRGSVTFHHSKMPHMTTANASGAYRKAVANHMQEYGAGGEGDHYRWKFYVDQATGRTIVPPRR